MREARIGCKSHRDRVGILLAQLGTPDAPTPEKLRPYLRQFLSDRRVIEVNRFVWWLVLRGVVLRTRPARSAALYQRIWGKDGSPLLTITKDQTNILRERLTAEIPGVQVAFGMRYGQPSLEGAIDSLIAQGCTKLLLLPMYPQYSAATTASTYDVVFAHLLKRRWVPTLRVVEPYYRHDGYVAALATTINEGLAAMGEPPSHLVLSYHGIPERYVEKGDPYCCMCTETTRALIPKLHISADRVIHTYQSRFGKDPWLVPYTDETIEALAKDGATRIAVAAPGFTADCLETLDELGNEGRHLFEEHGGKELRVIPCLNTHPAWMEALYGITMEELGSWSRARGACSSLSCPVARAKTGAPFGSQFLENIGSECVG
jgi:ferrochelatase